MVDGGDGGQDRLNAEEAVSQCLVVVDHVEFVAAGPQFPEGAQGEGERFREARGPHGRDFQRVDQVPPFAHRRRLEGVLVVVQVQAGDRVEGDTVVEHGVGLAGQDAHMVSERGEFAGEVPDVDTLAAAVGLAAVGEQGNAQRTVKRHGNPSQARRRGSTRG